MQKLKNEKGITLIALAVTIMIISLITVPIAINIPNIVQFSNYSKFKGDIDNLREGISATFYDKEISTIGPKYTGNLDFLQIQQNGNLIKNANDNNNYYVININKMNENLPNNFEGLNFGEGNKNISSNASEYNGTDDVYIINEASKTIYYVKGVLYKGLKYYRLSENFSVAVDEGIVPGEKVTDLDKTFTDKNGEKVKIPVGFKVSTNTAEQTVAKGLVILDDAGNEFVWIPVGKFKDGNGQTIQIDYDRYKFGNQFMGKIDQNSSARIYNNIIDEYYFYEKRNNFEYVSTVENKGFYIGRYETGSTNTRTSTSTATNGEALVKKNVNVYNYINRQEAISVSESFKNTDNVKSRLCSSYAWDTTLKFLEKTGNVGYLTNSSQGNYTNALKTTGQTTSINNIYDLAGNVYEWTTELSSDADNMYTIRGGSIGKKATDEPVINRVKQVSTKVNNIGFRITLFLNINEG